MSLETVNICDQFQPFGMENYQPLFILRNVALGVPRFIGAKSDHVKWLGRIGETELDIIGFGMGDRLKTKSLDRVDLLGYLEKNEWNNQTRLQLRLIDYQPTDENIELTD